MSNASPASMAPGGDSRMLAASLARVVRDHPVPDPWQPGMAADDSQTGPASDLESALDGVGWASLADEDVEPSLIAVAAVELGRGLVSLHAVDVLLGGSPVISGLVRHGRPGHVSLEFLPGERLRELELLVLEPVPYGDASGVATIARARPGKVVPSDLAARRLEAWRAASIGYLAGLTSAAFDDCLAHVRTRQAFGSSLDALDTVQSRLADAAAALDGAHLVVEHEHSWSALSYAGATAVQVTACCHQLTGALGFTLEYPLQRRSRRARAMRTWAECAADVSTTPASPRGEDDPDGH